MNYYEWSQEYENTAREMDSMVMRLKKQRAAKGKSDKKELDDKIAFYRSLRNECLRIAAHLRKRSKGVA
ncbi:MAG: hypothetical protein II118_00605 [Ruminococcus sp.]|jgi:hypothetical protein|nr:hypothetical protein [Ruminococcus sp.]MBQ1382140.1 hypothetical protein [Ruminococcus sp.]MBQ1638784.1 hypothetical protein [Ruminococcus sp.]MBQ1807674.1 hypothetical protein [Ruminococcus sp.]MBQ1813347.1 hypothetical protein [Ruminococcus sp.]